MMNDKYDRVHAAINRFEEIQARQVEDFDKMLMPDLEAQTQERDRGFEQFKQEVSGFIALVEQENTPARTESMILNLRDRIRTLLTQNEALTIKVKLHKDRLRQSMKGLAKGKQAIGGYRSPAFVANRPRAINLAN